MVYDCAPVTADHESVAALELMWDSDRPVVLLQVVVVGVVLVVNVIIDE